MAIRGPYIIPRRGRMMWHIEGIHFFQRQRFPGSQVPHNRPRRRK